MSNRNKYLAGLLLPLAFAMPAHGGSKLEKLASDNTSSFNQLSNPSYQTVEVPTPAAPEKTDAKADSVYSDLGLKEYNFTMCVKDTIEEDRLKLRLTHHVVEKRKNKLVRDQLIFYMTNIYGNEQSMEGGFPINNEFPSPDSYFFEKDMKLGEYHEVLGDSSRRIRSTIDIYASKPYDTKAKKQCTDVHVKVNYELRSDADNKSSDKEVITSTHTHFGDLLPHKK